MLVLFLNISSNIYTTHDIIICTWNYILYCCSSASCAIPHKAYYIRVQCAYYVWKRNAICDRFLRVEFKWRCTTISVAGKTLKLLPVLIYDFPPATPITYAATIYKQFIFFFFFPRIRSVERILGAIYYNIIAL